MTLTMCLWSGATTGWTASHPSAPGSWGGERAPHGPLLLVYALGRLQLFGTSEMNYLGAEPVVALECRHHRVTGPRASLIG